MWLRIVSSTLTGCTFTNNTADIGAGMRCGYQSDPTLTNCTFIGNAAVSRGGGMHNSAQSAARTRAAL